MDHHKISLLDGLILRSIIMNDRPHFIEVGCNDGVDSAKFLEMFPECKLDCWEVDPRAIAQFRERIHDERCSLFTYAISDQDGTAEFHQSGGTTAGAHKQDWDLSGSLNKPTGHLKQSPWCTFDNKITVPTRRLDTAYELPNRPENDRYFDLLWIDVQGAEAKVIDGGRWVLAHTQYVYLEYGHWKEPLYEGQMNLDETIAKLGPDWEPIATYEGYNLLAANTKFVPRD